MERDEAQRALYRGELTGAVIKPARDANGWTILLEDLAGGHVPYTGHTGTEKVYHDLDQATRVARELGCDSIRVEEEF